MARATEFGRRCDGIRLVVWAFSLVLLSHFLAWAGPSIHLPDVTAATGPETPDEVAVRRLLGDYARAIEHKDLALFRTVKPNLTKEEEPRLQKAFASVQAQVRKVTVSPSRSRSGRPRCGSCGGTPSTAP